jgi:quinoprotein glucose dehydrogenase
MKAENVQKPEGGFFDSYLTAAGRAGRIAWCIVLALASSPVAAQGPASDRNDPDSKYSPLKQIDVSNVADLQPAWIYHTGEMPPGDAKNAMIAFEDQPSLIDGNLVVCTPSRRVIALDPRTGRQRWAFDPKSRTVGMRKCRGVSHWIDAQAADGAACSSRIFLGTVDYSLIAIDARNGKRCDAFGDHGEVKMKPSEPELFPGEVIATSKPAVIGDVVVVGSVVADDQRVDAPSGKVHAFDARSGRLLWTFDPVPHDPADPAASTWAKRTGDGYGAANVWANMAVDPALDLVYLPTTSPSGDFYGAGRAGNNDYTSSVVALRGTTGQVVWHFQFVHHNIFDYDTPTEPMLIDWPLPDGSTVPALVQNNKTGLVFAFNRATGAPLVPIVERPVPQAGAVPGEVPSPTQPFPVGMPAVTPEGFSIKDVWGFTPVDKWLCRRKVEKLVYGPMFTPPSVKGTVFLPSGGGGPNWGGGAYDPATHIMVVPSNRVPMVVTLIPRDSVRLDRAQSIEAGGAMLFANAGTPYAVKVEPLLSPLGAPCSAPPWASLTAVDLAEHKIVWEVPLGSIEGMMPFHVPSSLMDPNLGTPGAGGPLVTAGGLVFIGYTLDDSIRAFDLRSGRVLWKAALPAAGVGVPVTYEAGGDQYVVIPAGGHSMYHSTMGDAVVAFKLEHPTGH